MPFSLFYSVEGNFLVGLNEILDYRRLKCALFLHFLHCLTHYGQLKINIY